MKLTKKTRERLYKAEGKPIEITWPEDAPAPHAGRRYAVYGEKGEKVFTVRLERSKRATGLNTGTKAIVKIDNDPHRPLIGISGTRNDLGDYESEPEQVSEEYQEWLSMQGGAKTALQGSELRIQAARQRKEARAGEQKTSRSAKAVERHRKSVARRFAVRQTVETTSSPVPDPQIAAISSGV